MTENHQQQGYSLIELLVVIGITVILMVTAVALFFTTLQGGGRTAGAEYAKQIGQNTVNQLTYLIRNARRIVPNREGITCANGMVSLGVEGLDGGITYLYSDQTNAGRIASNSGTFLTPSDIYVTSALAIDCTPANYAQAGWDGSPPRITIRFTLQKGQTGVDKQRDIIAIPFESTVTLRNY